jgi:exodeoxyribonuclease V alpha subunit
MEDVIPSIPQDAVTIHRLIGWNPGTGKPRFHAGNRLPFDIVILDEASMVDLALLSRLVVALPVQGRLILLGDKDQLASVEAGSVFGEIASVVDTNQLNDDVIKSVDIKYEDIIVRLKKSRRFSADSGIGFLAAMVNKGDAESSWGWLKDQNLVRGGDYGDPSLWLKDIISKVSAVHDKLLIEIDILREIISRDEDNISPIGSIINDLFRILGELQVLSAHRRGIYGSIYLNNRIDSILSEKSSFEKGNQNQQDEWYNGRPVIITSNNYDLSLFNGDIGIAMIIENQVKITFGYDEQAETITWYSPAQLANVETSWVLTVHKSQGSEFDNVDLIIPAETSPILTRELAYTALTRSRNKFELWGTENVWKEMINRKIERKSGLGKRILHD